MDDMTNIADISSVVQSSLSQTLFSSNEEMEALEENQVLSYQPSYPSNDQDDQLDNLMNQIGLEVQRKGGQ